MEGKSLRVLVVGMGYLAVRIVYLAWGTRNEGLVELRGFEKEGRKDSLSFLPLHKAMPPSPSGKQPMERSASKDGIFLRLLVVVLLVGLRCNSEASNIMSISLPGL